VLVNLVFELFDDELVVINEGCFLVLDLCGELVCYVGIELFEFGLKEGFVFINGIDGIFGMFVDFVMIGFGGVWFVGVIVEIVFEVVVFVVGVFDVEYVVCGGCEIVCDGWYLGLDVVVELCELIVVVS